MTSWYRLEPNAADPDLAESTQARIADPLWALARQWQLGEFAGEDAASPVHVRAVLHTGRIAAFRNDAVPGAAIEPFRSDQPLSCRVEAEDVLAGPAALLLAAEAGVQFLRRLEAAGLGALRQGVDWSAVLGFDPSTVENGLGPLPDREAVRLALIARRGLDGRRLYRLDPAGLAALVPDGVTVPAEALATVLQQWRAEYGQRVAQPEGSGDCWSAERFEYQFSLGVATEDGEVVLRADEYPGGTLDWYALDVAPGDSHGLAAHPPTRRQIELLPQPVTFQGQAAPRWWEFEDRTVSFGNLSAGPADVARLAVAEFGTVSSDDWYVVPVTVPTGSLCRITEAHVLDVFGDIATVRSTAVNDHETYGTGRPFRHFELDGDDSAAQGRTPWLLVLPALADAQHGPPVERIWLVRDEQANLGWGIEQAIELPTGNPMRRRQQWTVPAVSGTPTWQYRLQTPVPPWWIPLVPERIGGGPEIRLRRGRMQGWAELAPELAGAKGRLLGVARALRIPEEEVPRGGAQVVRQWQRARGDDGHAVLWMARRKRPGRGDRGSGLQFDAIQR